MAITLKQITGKIVIPGTTIGIRATVTATPMTKAQALTFPIDDVLSWGPVVATTDANGVLPASFKIPTNSEQQAQELLWKFTAEPIDKHGPVPKSWLMGHYEITGTGTVNLADLVNVDITAIPTAVYIDIQTLVANAGTFAGAANTAAISASNSATTASNAASIAADSADTAVNAAGLASEIALGDAGAALAAADADPGSAFRGQIDARLGGTFAAVSNLAVNVKSPQFGALGDGTTDDTAAIQAAIDYAATLGGVTSPGSTTARLGAEVFLPPGVYVISAALVLPYGVVLQGSGTTSTTIKKAVQGAAHWMLESKDYALLSGSNKWFDSEGVPSAFGARDLIIYGNANPPVTATDRGGIRFYGRRIFLERVIVHNIDGDGVVLECANVVGQTAWNDMPEGHIDMVSVWKPGRDGFTYKGPHDMPIGSIFVAQAQRDGAVFSRGATWAAACEVKLLHTYANVGVGCRLESPMHFDNLITESNGAEGLIVGDAPNTKITWLVAYSNNIDGTASYQVEIGNLASRFAIGTLHMPAALGANTGGLRNLSDRVQVGNIDIGAEAGNTGTGIYNSGGYCSFKGVVRNFSGAGGKGLVTSDGGYCNYDLTFVDCNTFVSSSGDFLHSAFRIRGRATDPACTLWDGGPTATQRRHVDVDFHVKLGTTTYSSKCRAAGTGIDIATADTYTITIPHGLYTTPSVSEVDISVSYAGSNHGWRIHGPYVTAVDATNITVVAVVTTTIATPAFQPIVQVSVDL